MTGDWSDVPTAPRARSRSGPDNAGSVAVHRGDAELDRGRRQLGDGPVGDARASLLLAASLLAADAPDRADAARLLAVDAAWAAGDVTACLSTLDGTGGGGHEASGPSGVSADGPERRRSRAHDAFLRDYRAGMRAMLARQPDRATGPLRRVLEHARTEGGPPEQLLRAAAAALLLGDVHAARA
ncbi:hypothetical protein ACHBTE_23105, partial [Streptomyces sp. M41]